MYPEIIKQEEKEELDGALSKVKKFALEFEVKNDEDLTRSADVLSEIAAAEKVVTTRKEEITKPLMASLSSVRTLFRPYEDDFASAKKTIKNKVLQYNLLKEEEAEKERQRLAARVEKGTMKAETAVKKMGEIEEAPKTVQGTSGGKITTRIIKKMRILNEADLPREFLVPDEKKILEALKEGIVVPGAELYDEKILSVK